MVEGEYQRAFAIMKLNEDYADQKNITLEMDSAYLHESRFYNILWNKSINT